MLSFVAGIVNVCGFLSMKVLTTNVTGHFANFSDEIFKGNDAIGITYLGFILSFLLGAFVSGIIVESISIKNVIISYSLPLIIEVSLLSLVALSDLPIIGFERSVNNIMACILLFAMGLQNALVTKVSQSVVRTTHLTGLFTDLGIELSQFVYYNTALRNNKLRKSILLKLAIIICFFLGCVSGGFGYEKYGLKALFIAIVILMVALFYDIILLHFYYLKRKIRIKP